MGRILTLGLLLCLPLTSNALPLPKEKVSMMTVPPTFTTDYNFEGIVGLSNCSGSLIQLENAVDTDPALILTNGHCLEFGFPQPGQVIHDKPSSRSFSLFDASGKTVGTLNATKVVYSTMTDTDMTIYQLKQTYASIRSAYKVSPFTLSSIKGSLSQPIQVISGYWHRGYTCGIEAFAYEVHEDAWIWHDSLRYSRPGCEVIGGTSGSPVVGVGTRTVFAVNNTINEDNEKCTFNNPCEVDSHGAVTFHQGYGYAQETYLVYTCLNSNRQFDLSVPGCKLPH